MKNEGNLDEVIAGTVRNAYINGTPEERAELKRQYKKQKFADLEKFKKYKVEHKDDTLPSYQKAEAKYKKILTYEKGSDLIIPDYEFSPVCGHYFDEKEKFLASRNIVCGILSDSLERSGLLESEVFDAIDNPSEIIYGLVKEVFEAYKKVDALANVKKDSQKKGVLEEMAITEHVESENPSQKKSSTKQKRQPLRKKSKEGYFNADARNDLIKYFDENNYLGFVDSNIEEHFLDVVRNGRSYMKSLNVNLEPKADYSALKKNLKLIKENKKSIDKKINLNGQDNFFYNVVNFFDEKFTGNLEEKINQQKESLKVFDSGLVNSSRNLKRHITNVRKGFDNLSYDWIDTEENIKNYKADIDFAKDMKTNTHVFSWTPLKNFRRIRELKKNIKEYKNEINSLDKSKKEIEKSFEIYSKVLDKNLENLDFVQNLVNEKNNHVNLLNDVKNQPSKRVVEFAL